MKQGRTLQEMAAEIARQRDTKRDFLADTRGMSVREYDGRHRNSWSRTSTSGSSTSNPRSGWCGPSMGM
jgi:hypothetical protein